MIDILQYRELCLDIMAKTNNLLSESGKATIDDMVMAVREDHLVKQLQNKAGITLCCSFPDAQSQGTDDNAFDRQQAYFFIVQRVSPGQFSDEDLLVGYQKLQYIMTGLRKVIREYYSNCMSVIPEESYKIEWEYQIFGGVNGLSMGINFKNYD